MKRSKWALLLPMGVCLLIGAAKNVEGQGLDRCVAIAHIGLIEENSVQEFSNVFLRFHQRIQTEDYATFDSADNLALSLSIPIKEITAMFGFEWNAERYSEFRKLHINEVDRLVHEVWGKSVYGRKTNEAAADLIRDCLGIPGLMAWAEYHPLAPSDVHLVLKLHQNFSRPPARVNLNYTPTVNCGFWVGDKIIRKSKVEVPHGDPLTLHCQRLPPLDKTASITVNSSNEPILSGGSIWLPPAELPCLPFDSEVSITLTGGKNEEIGRRLGPYCESMVVDIVGTASGNQHTAGVATLRVNLVSDGEICGSDLDSSADGNLRSLSASCRLILQKGDITNVSLSPTDGLADITETRLTLTVRKLGM